MGYDWGFFWFVVGLGLAIILNMHVVLPWLKDELMTKGMMTDSDQEQALAYHSQSHPAQATFNLTDNKTKEISCDLVSGQCSVIR